MKKLSFLLSTLIFLLSCAGKQKSSTLQDLIALLLAQPGSYQVSANISNGAPVANAMVYFSKATASSTSASIRAATDASSVATVTGPVFETSSQTDANGNILFTLAVGDYEAIITSTDNKSQAFKIKIERSSGLSLTKDGKATITFADGSVKVAILKVKEGVGVPSAITFVCGYNPQGDTAPAEILGVELGSSTVDLSSGSGTVKIKAKLADGYEGVAAAKRASGIRFVTAKLFSPKRLTGNGYTAYAKLTINPATGFYEGDATLPNYVENGTWKAGLIGARDFAGNDREFILDSSKSASNYTFNGCGQKIDSRIPIPSFEVTGSSPDTAAPAIGTITIDYSINAAAPTGANGVTINITPSVETPKEVVMTITATGADDTGGTGNASGIKYMDARLQSYSWWNSSSNYLGNAIYVRLERISGTDTSGTYQGTATIRSYAEGNTGGDGLWKVGGMWVIDRAGNSLWTDRTLVNKSFTITNASTTANADFYPPELKSITLDKTDVNFDQNFKITADVEDLAAETTTADQNSTTTTASTTTTSLNNATPSGIKSVKAILYSPSKLLDDTLGVTKSSSLVLNASTGKYEGTLNFPSANNEEGGAWKVGWVEVVDKAGNYRIYRLSEGYTNYTYVKLSRVDGDVTSSFIVTGLIPGSITRN